MNTMVRGIKPYVGITLGGIIFAFGLNYFTIANKLAEGGVTGLALLGHYLLGLPVGPILLALNIPLFAVGWYFLGWRFVLRSLYGTAVVSLAVQFIGLGAVPVSDRLVAAIYAGVISGLGLGVILRSGGTSGGVDIIARILWHRKGIEMGSTMFIGDAIVMGMAAVLMNRDTALYSLVAMFIASRVIDFVQEGASAAKAVTIVSNAPAEISAAVVESLDRTTTLVPSRGAYTGQSRDLVYVVVPRAEITHLKNIVFAADPSAFVIIDDVREVVGEGFSPRTPRP